MGRGEGDGNARGAGLARVVAVGNLKGGTGKSTVAVNLACAVAAEGRSCALVDTDPQGTATRWAEKRRLPVACWSQPLRALDEVGGWLAAATALRGRYDLVVLDLPSVARHPFLAACFMADLVLVPASPLAADLEGTRRALIDFRLVRRERAALPPSLLLVPARAARERLSPPGETLDLAVLGEPVAPPLHLDPRHDRAFRAGEWVGGLFPGTTAHREVLALAATVHAALRRTPPASPALGARVPALVRMVGRSAPGAAVIPPRPCPALPPAGRGEAWWSGPRRWLRLAGAG
jgi:chromosome partitioning protein